MILEGNVDENAHGTGNVRRDDAFRNIDMPRRGANYTHYPILSRSSMSYVSSHAIDSTTSKELKMAYGTLSEIHFKAESMLEHN